MASLSLFPMFLDPLGGGGTAGGDGLIVELLADPDITLDPDIAITLAADDIDISVDPDIEIEVE